MSRKDNVLTATYMFKLQAENAITNKEQMRVYPASMIGFCEVVTDLLEEQPKWIPISERLPDYDQDVLVYAAEKDNREDGTMIISRRYVMRIIPSSPGFDTWRTPQYFTSCYEITHWMPLPKPPKKDGEQE